MTIEYFKNTAGIEDLPREALGYSQEYRGSCLGNSDKLGSVWRHLILKPFNVAYGQTCEGLLIGLCTHVVRKWTTGDVVCYLVDTGQGINQGIKEFAPTDLINVFFSKPKSGDALIVARDIHVGSDTIPYGTPVYYTGHKENLLNARGIVNCKHTHGEGLDFDISIFDLRTLSDWHKHTTGYSTTDTKPTNPKEDAGHTKTPIHLVPQEVIQGIAEALYEGSLKYGKENYLEAGVRYSTYYSATLRHLLAWFSGEDVDPDSGLEHLTKALASLSVLYSAIHRQAPHNTDDRSKTVLSDWKLKVSSINSKLGVNNV